jgi:hypothetical protein
MGNPLVERLMEIGRRLRCAKPKPLLLEVEEMMDIKKELEAIERDLAKQKPRQ